MNLRKLIEMVGILNTRVDKIEGVTPNTETQETPETKTETPGTPETPAAPEAKTEGGETTTGETPDGGSLEGGAETKETANLADLVSALETRVGKAEADLADHKARLDSEFDARVKAEAAKIAADAVAGNAAPPVKTGPATDADKAALAGLKGRALLEAKIRTELNGLGK